MIKTAQKLGLLLTVVMVMQCSGEHELDICTLCTCVLGGPVFCNYVFLQGRQWHHFYTEYVNTPQFNYSQTLPLKPLPSYFRSIRNMTLLDLSSNALNAIDGSMFQDFRYLKQINLKENIFQKIPSFHKSTSLRHLNMNFNAIHSIPRDFHLDVPNLETLTLEYNKLRYIQGNQLPRNLTYISLAGNLIRTVSCEALAGLNHLQSVKFTNNQIFVITAKTFSLPLLQTIQLSGNRISVIEKNSFSKTLRKLILNKNKLRDFSALDSYMNLEYAILDDQNREESPQGIPFLPRLEWLFLSHIKGNSAVASIQEKAPRLHSLTVINGNIPHLQLTNSSIMLQLILTSNSIKTVGNMSKIPRLIFLSMKNNLLQSIPNISGLHLLEELDLSNNRIRYVSATDFLNLDYLSAISLWANQIVLVEGHFRNSKLSLIDLTSNHIAKVDQDVFSSLRVSTIRLNHNQLQTTSIMTYNSHMVFLSYAYNKIFLIDHSSLTGLIRLEHLDLSNNMISHITGMSFLPHLEYLILDHNPIMLIYYSAFLNLPKLKFLSIQYSNIVSFPAMQRTFSVQYLVLKGNNLTSIPQNLSHVFPNLVYLNLNDNGIEEFDADTIFMLEKLASLEFEGNPVKHFHEHCPMTTNSKRLVKISLGSDITQSISPCLFKILKRGTNIHITGSNNLVLSSHILCEQQKKKHVIQLTGVQVDKVRDDGCPLLTYQNNIQSQFSSADHTFTIMHEQGQTHILILNDVKLNGFNKNGTSISYAAKTTHFTYSNSSLLTLPIVHAPMALLLNLSNNLIQVFDVHDFYSLFPKVENLLLSNNHIRVLSNCKSTIDSFHPLHSLDLSGNDLSRFSNWLCSSGYRVFHSLKRLYLEDNALEELPMSLLPRSNPTKPPYKLKLYLNRNPITCDCTHRWLVNIEDRFNIQGTCITPFRKDISSLESLIVNDFPCPLTLLGHEFCSVTNSSTILLTCPVTSHPDPLIQWTFMFTERTHDNQKPSPKTFVSSNLSERSLEIIPFPYATETIPLVCSATAHGDTMEIDLSIHLTWDTGNFGETWNMSCTYQVHNTVTVASGGRDNLKENQSIDATVSSATHNRMAWTRRKSYLIKTYLHILVALLINVNLYHI